MEKTDIITIISKGALGAIPFVGPLAAEIIGATIPNQRIDRIESYLKILELKIPENDKKLIEEKMKRPESVDLLEDSFIQVSRALSEERKDYIASLMKNSLTNENLEYLEYKKLLSILGELNDFEIIILNSYSLRRGTPEYTEFMDLHEDILMAPSICIGSSREEIEKATMFKTHKIHLVKLGLLEPKFKKPKKGEFPEFDEKTGMIKYSRYSLSHLGRLLLRTIDQSCEE